MEVAAVVGISAVVTHFVTYHKIVTSTLCHFLSTREDTSMLTCDDGSASLQQDKFDIAMCHLQGGDVRETYAFAGCGRGQNSHELEV